MTYRKLIACLLIAGFAALTTACNTVEGFGQDVENTGGAVKDAAD